MPKPLDAGVHVLIHTSKWERGRRKGREGDGSGRREELERRMKRERERRRG